MYLPHTRIPAPMDSWCPVTCGLSENFSDGAWASSNPGLLEVNGLPGLSGVLASRIPGINGFLVSWCARGLGPNRSRKRLRPPVRDWKASESLIVSDAWILFAFGMTIHAGEIYQWLLFQLATQRLTVRGPCRNPIPLCCCL